MSDKPSNNHNEKGNVLFLILIAVALFAALSYAVTQSTRSGSGSTEKEKAILSGASMTQHPTAIRTGLIRMVLGGVDVSNIKFTAPANFAAVSEKGQLVFHPTGGGAVYQLAPADLMANSALGTWYFNANWDLPEVGTDGAGGNDITAFLPGITQTVCRRINDEFSISANGCTSNDGLIPDLDSSTDDANIREDMDETYVMPVTDQEDLQNATCTVFSGQASGCFYDSDNSEYVFYSVLLER